MLVLSSFLPLLLTLHYWNRACHNFPGYTSGYWDWDWGLVLIWPMICVKLPPSVKINNKNKIIWSAIACVICLEWTPPSLFFLFFSFLGKRNRSYETYWPMRSFSYTTTTTTNYYYKYNNKNTTNNNWCIRLNFLINFTLKSHNKGINARVRTRRVAGRGRVFHVVA